jgi:folate-dependent phosphoribosylglycinamide formyltransferase PurN
MDPLRVALLTSKHAEGVSGLLADPNRGTTWNLSIVVSADAELSCMQELEELGIPVELRPLRQWPSYRNLRARESYDDATGELLARMNVDYVLLAGYPFLITEPLLARFPRRILGIHDADLSNRDRLYEGAHAVRHALLAGESETRSSVSLLTTEVGRGPLFLLSGPFPVASMARDARERGDIQFLEAYARLHRQWMIQSTWGAMLARTLELLAAGTQEVIGDIVWIDGAPGPCRMGESPGMCHHEEAMITRGIPRSCPFISS